MLASVPVTEYDWRPQSGLLYVKAGIWISVVNPVDKSVKTYCWFHNPPDITFPFEQSTTLMVDGKERIAGVFPNAVTTRLNVRVVSKFVIICTWFTLTMLAPVPEIEYAERLQSGLLYVNGAIVKSVVEPIDRSEITKFWFHVPPEIILPFEQFTILIVVGKIRVAGVFPIAVTTKLKFIVVSA